MSNNRRTRPALLLALLLVAMLATGAGAPRCKLFPTRGRYSCWCYGAYGWRSAPALLCQVWGGAR